MCRSDAIAARQSAGTFYGYPGCHCQCLAATAKIHSPEGHDTVPVLQNDRSGFRVRARPGLGDPWSMCSTCKPPHDPQLIRQASDSCRRPESPGRRIKVPQAAGIRLVTESWSCCNSIRHGDVMCVARSILVNVLHTAASTIKVLGSQFPSPARQACHRFSFIH